MFVILPPERVMVPALASMPRVQLSMEPPVIVKVLLVPDDPDDSMLTPVCMPLIVPFLSVTWPTVDLILMPMLPF